MNKAAHVVWATIRLHPTVSIGPALSQTLSQNALPTAAQHVNVRPFARVARHLSSVALSPPAVKQASAAVTRASSLAIPSADASYSSARLFSTSPVTSASQGSNESSDGGSGGSGDSGEKKPSSRYAWIDDVRFSVFQSSFPARLKTIPCITRTHIRTCTSQGGSF